MLSRPCTGLLFGSYLFSPIYSSSFYLWMVCTYSHPYTAHLEKTGTNDIFRILIFVDNLVIQLILVDHFFTAGKVWWFSILSIPFNIKTKNVILDLNKSLWKNLKAILFFSQTDGQAALIEYCTVLLLQPCIVKLVP